MHDSLTTSWFQNKYSFEDFTEYNPPSLEKVKNGIKVTSPAKINLYLKIKPLLATSDMQDYKNKFHDIETVYTAITLSDHIYLYMEKESENLQLHCNVPELMNSSNVVAVVLKNLLDTYGIKNIGLQILLQKNIPAGGGLGGESSNVVFTYLAFHKLFDIPINFIRAKKFITKFSTDALFFLYGGIALGTGLPDTIKPVDIYSFIKKKKLFYPEKKFNRKYVLLIYPFLQTSSRYMYKEFDKIPPSNIEEPRNFIYNSFEKILCKKYRKIKIILDKIKELGYTGMSGISGSGSTIFVLFESKEEVMYLWNKLINSFEFTISGAAAKLQGNWHKFFKQ